ncbi:hypothetical protein GCM10027435_10740 [Haloparvum alkalitolerans]
MNTFWRSFWTERNTVAAASRPSDKVCWVSSSRALAIPGRKRVAVINLFERRRSRTPAVGGDPAALSKKAYNSPVAYVG